MDALRRGLFPLSYQPRYSYPRNISSAIFETQGSSVIELSSLEGNKNKVSLHMLKPLRVDKGTF